MSKKILFLTGSLNQTSQMYQVASALGEFDCWFSQLFTDHPLVNFLKNKTRLLDKTIISEPHRKKAEAYLKERDCAIDYGGSRHRYDLIVCCSDLIVPAPLKQTRTVWIQEGMIDKMTLLSRIIKALRLPPTWCFNTSLNGSTNQCDLYCAASDGYRDYISGMGTDPGKIWVTGTPNYDHAAQFLDNDFPYHDYVMVATTDMRETARPENRVRFIKKCVAIAAGRPLLFKLHPNENFDRAIGEIRQHTPEDTAIFTEGNTQHMIANCSELITQYSTVVYTGIALGKKVHSYFDVRQLKRLSPLQNGGTSAEQIATLCRSFIDFDGPVQDFLHQYKEQQDAALLYFINEKEQSYAG
ncbi:hypothetical protein [Taibaiella koreensis]|uniref:hypothetical protein n=1 Tax=Taibaiella koreensis TaxID=1268548 RepID=UPI001968EA29|nr:hypothetical protein [Taibaiella koreensis]